MLVERQMRQSKGEAVLAILLSVLLLSSASADGARMLTKIKTAYRGSAAPLALLPSGGRRMLLEMGPSHRPATPIHR